MKKDVFILIITLIILLIPFNSSLGQQKQGQTIKDYLQEILPPQEGRKIVLDETTGLLTITDTPSNQKLIKRLIESWDVGQQQIRIEARFVDLSEDVLNELGVEWLAKRSGTRPYIGEGPTRSSTGTAAERPPVYQSTEPGESTVYHYEYGSRAIPPWSGTEMGAPAEVAGLGLWLGTTKVSGTALWAYLRALEGRNKANLLSAPTVTTLSGQTANIELAEVIPYASSYEQTDTSTSTETNYGLYETYKIEEKKTGIFLEVTPTVSRGTDIVTLNLHPEVSNVSHQVDITNSSEFPSNLGWPIVKTRSTQTTVTVKSGETIVIGGLVNDDETTTKRKVPLLGNIPLLGNLFKWEHTSRTKRNLVVFVTATIVTPEGEQIK